VGCTVPGLKSGRNADDKKRHARTSRSPRLFVDLDSSLYFFFISFFFDLPQNGIKKVYCT
jgi:hypothetical protein